MPISSFRAVLLALAMVLQTVAGGVGVARAMPAGLAVSAQCAAISGKAEAARAGHRDGRQDQRHQDCDACCLCDGTAGVSVVDDVVVSFAPRACRATRFAPNASSAAPARLPEAHRARGPPGAERA
jgi:hypothetical protein